MKLKTTALVVLLSMIVLNTVFAATLYEMYGGKSVKVYVAPVKDSTKDHEVNLDSFATELKDGLKERKSIRFSIVDSKEAADIVIEADLKDFMWTDHDPLDMLVGVGAAAADAAMVEDYAQLMTDYKVTSAKNGTVLWQDTVRATITKKPMSRTESVPLVSEDSVKEFIKHCFGKKKR